MPVFSIYNRAPTNLSPNNTNNITPAKRKHELFIEQTASGGYNPIKFNAETKFYYRMSFYKNRKGFLWDGSKVEFGIENNFSLSSDMVGAYADIRPLSFFGIRAGGYFIIMYDIMNFGYAGFDTNEGIDYSAEALFKKQKYNIHTHLPCTAPHPAQHPAGRLCCALAAGRYSVSAGTWFSQEFLCASFLHQKRSIRSFDYQSCRCFFYPSWNCIQTFFTRCSLC